MHAKFTVRSSEPPAVTTAVGFHAANMSNIQQMVARGESETLEFKERFNADVIETAVAFANTVVVKY